MKKATHEKDDFYTFYSSETGGKGARVSFRKKKSASPFIRIGFALFLGALAASAWFGYLFFSQQIGGYSSDPLELEVKAVQEAENGAVVEYQITYTNRSSDIIENVGVFAEYPIGFSALESKPAFETIKKNYWDIGALQAGQRGEIVIKGTLTGFENEERKAIFSLQYANPLYRSSFTIKKEVVTRMLAARGEHLSIEGPETLYAGDRGTFTIRYQDVSKLGNPEEVILSLSLPDGVTIEKAHPEISDKEKKEWNGFSLSKTIRPDLEGGNLTIDLAIADHVQGKVSLTARLVIRTVEQGSDTQLQEVAREITVVRSDLAFSLLTPNGTPLTALQLGARNQFRIEFFNRGNVTFKDIELTFSSEHPVIDQDASSCEGAQETKEGIYLWSAKQTPSLRVLPSNERGAVLCTIVLRGPGELNTEDLKKSGIPFSLDARIGSREEGKGKVISESLDISGPRVSIAILSDARFRAFVRDVSSEKKEVKVFRVYLAVTNSIHDLDELEMSVYLPSSVQWSMVNSRTAGDIRYDPETRQVAWKLNTLPASVPRIDGSFDITIPERALTPETRLIERLLFRARDRQAQAIIEQSIEALTSIQNQDAL